MNRALKLDLYGIEHRDGWQIIAPGPCFDYSGLLAALAGMPAGSAAEIHAWHILNKLTSPDQVALLKECRRVLRPDGIFAGAVPDMDVLCRLYVSLADPGLRMAIGTQIYGDHSTPAAINHAGFNADILTICLLAGGFRNPSLPGKPYLAGQPATLIEGIPIDLHFVAEA
jgi:hypothetical protein